MAEKEARQSSSSSSEGAEIADQFKEETDKKKTQKHKQRKKELKKIKAGRAASNEVCVWIQNLGLPPLVTEKYIQLFTEEEIYTLQQVANLKEHHLHEWMGVKTGTVLTMLDAIKKLPAQLSANPNTAASLSLSIPSDPTLKNRFATPENDSKKSLAKKDEGVYQAGGHGGVVRTTPGLVKKKTVAAEISFYKEFSSIPPEKIPTSIRGFFPRFEGAGKNAQKLENALGSFFLTGDLQPRIDVLKFLVQRLEVLHQWMEKQTFFRFYSSSLLFVFDADPAAKTKVDVRMIDFAHVFTITDGGIDDGYVKGLQSILKSFKRFLKRKRDLDGDAESFYDTEFKDQFKDFDESSESFEKKKHHAKHTPVLSPTNSVESSDDSEWSSEDKKERTEKKSVNARDRDNKDREPVQKETTRDRDTKDKEPKELKDRDPRDKDKDAQRDRETREKRDEGDKEEKMKRPRLDNLKEIEDTTGEGRASSGRREVGKGERDLQRRHTKEIVTEDAEELPSRPDSKATTPKSSRSRIDQSPGEETPVSFSPTKQNEIRKSITITNATNEDEKDKSDKKSDKKKKK